ncbi:unnamed protein product [Nippostrongylus brasiliensis]|uniref:Secreted protein n=1 Tax=Nippostrongylus brasiliensis TaxID=27835 RepID=A0A0N4Y1F5_NIPBR|nr:unnamed protein product [Nippostrongylus brasiliensis]
MAAKGAGVKPSLLVLFSSQLQLVITGSDEALLVRETIRLKSVASRSIATPITLASTTSPGRTDRISPMRLPRDLKTTNWSMQTLGMGIHRKCWSEYDTLGIGNGIDHFSSL